MAHPAQAHPAPQSVPPLAGRPFTTLPFVAQPGSRRRRRYWSPPKASSYGQASTIGAQCGAQLVAWLRANPYPEGEALLIWTLLDAYSAPNSEIQTGYRAGLVSQIARALSGRAVLSTSLEN